MGEAALVFNPAPGLYFTAVDMIRNQLLAPIMNKSLQEQEDLFREIWCAPIESFFLKSNKLDIDKFNECLDDYVQQKAAQYNHVSKAETSYLAAVK